MQNVIIKLIQTKNDTVAIELWIRIFYYWIGSVIRYAFMHLNAAKLFVIAPNEPQSCCF
jgi:hypothetical protein